MQKLNKKIVSLQLFPINIFMIIFFIIPILILLIYSFYRFENYKIIKEITIVCYENVLKNKLFMNILGRTIGIGLLVSVISIIISYPMVYGIVFKVKKFRDFLIFFIAISLLSSYLVKVYAWRTVLGYNGLINTFLLYTGIIRQPLEFLLFNKFSVFVALLHRLIPFVTLPLYSALLNINPDLLDAARDLGANPLSTFFKVTLPLSMSGIRTAFIFSFIIASGDYVIPQMLGGTSGLMVGRVIADQFGVVFNWGEGSALAFLLIFSDLIVFIMFSFFLSKVFLRKREI